MDVVMGNNGNVAWLNVAHEVRHGNVAHEVRRYVAGGRRRQAATLRKTKPVASGFIPDVPGFVPDVKPGFIPTSPGNVADKLRRYEKPWETKPVASGFTPDVKTGLAPDVKSGPIPASIGEK